jgi:hypothetical protein
MGYLRNSIVKKCDFIGEESPKTNETWQFLYFYKFIP